MSVVNFLNPDCAVLSATWLIVTVFPHDSATSAFSVAFIGVVAFISVIVRFAKS